MRVFADTFYWIALTDSADEFHVRAREVRRDIVTTDEVLTEYLTFFCAAPEFIRREVALAVEDILKHPAVKVISQSRESFLGGLRISRDISMQTMRREGLTDALTNDRHFEQEGFCALFR